MGGLLDSLFKMQVLDEPWLAVCWRGGGEGCLFRYMQTSVADP
jgi:hypothetical protein